MKKHEAFFEQNGITTISFLYNNAYEFDSFIAAGTRGWFHDEDATGVPDNTDFIKLMNREEGRLRLSLKEAVRLKEASPEKPIIAFTHFPPFWCGKAADNIVNTLREFNVEKVYFGHIHGSYAVPDTFTYEGIKMCLISADYLEFVPKIVTPD